MTLEKANEELRKSKLAWSDAMYKMRGTVSFPKSITSTPCTVFSRTKLVKTRHGVRKSVIRVSYDPVSGTYFDLN